jgi:RNA polymerase sigma-70 factor (ECF subfamily)
MDAGRLFEEHHRGLYRYLLRFCGDPDLAADAAQEAFVRLIERPPAESVERAWLYRVATNVVLDAARARGRRLQLLRAAPDRAPVADAPHDAHEQVVAAERRRLVRQALASLPDRDRAMLLMREEGFTHREIAEAVDTTTGSVGTMIARALERLARTLPLTGEEL